ncbi:MAG: pyruvate kinase [Candidatus Aegiribacteria sp.]
MIRKERSHAKLIATLGPSTSDSEVLKKLFLEGIDVCRLNFSHGNRNDHEISISMIHELNLTRIMCPGGTMSWR